MIYCLIKCPFLFFFARAFSPCLQYNDIAFHQRTNALQIIFFFSIQFFCIHPSSRSSQFAVAIRNNHSMNRSYGVSLIDKNAECLMRFIYFNFSVDSFLLFCFCLDLNRRAIISIAYGFCKWQIRMILYILHIIVVCVCNVHVCVLCVLCASDSVYA